MANSEIMTASVARNHMTDASSALTASALPNAMVAPDYNILATKFVIPSSPAQMVSRPRLLQPEESPRVRLVCAPAGYGKTTLIASWVHTSQSPVAWLSLDAGDNDPIRFLTHFICAIQIRFPDVGKVALDMMTAGPSPIAGLMRTLVNQLCDLPERLCIVLDDLHVVTETAVHEAIAFLVDHQPPQVQLIFSSRNDPAFSLARMRGQGQLLEYRTEDLRFTLEEADAFCNSVMQFSLPQDQVETLTARTEGWIVGLQLAAVSLRYSPDRGAFIQNFAGDNRHITDFLLDEVLRSRSVDIQNFLLQTSILERFNASLCDAVMETSDGRAKIDEMERANMFIFGLDHQRTWYRYHHLFASLLQGRLRDVTPDLVKVLHRRASQWFSENDLITEAIDHAIEAADYEFAVDLMEQHRNRLFSHGKTNTALAWARLLPEEVLAKRPALSLTCAWANFYMNNSVELDRHIRAVEHYLAALGETPLGGKERAMRAQVAMLRGCYCGYNGSIEGSLSHHLEAYASFTPGRPMHRASGTCLAIAYLVLGKLDQAQALFEEHCAISEVKNDVLAPIFATLGLGRVHLSRGRLLMAKGIFERALHECMEAGWQNFPACGMLHFGLGEVAYEMNDLALAEQHLSHGVDLTAAGMPYFNTWGRVMLARTRLASGAAGAILDSRQDASLMTFARRGIFESPPLHAVIGRLWLSQGRMDAVMLWTEALQLPIGERLALGRQPEYIVLARFFIASGQQVKAMNLLDRLWVEAEEGKHLAAMIEILILKALALQEHDATDDALAALQQAVSLAENTHLLRVFINEGSALGSLLKKLARGADYKSYVHSLLRHFGVGASQDATQGAPLLPQLLSKKELRVASYIITGAANKDIAEALFISPNTLNSHVKNIYAKLGVKTRLQAIERLRQLGLSD